MFMGLKTTNRDYKKEYEKHKASHVRYRSEHKDKYKKLNAEWIAKNRDRYNASKWILYDKNKRKILDRFSNSTMSCALCGNDDIFVLTLDHVNDDGAEHRKEALGVRRGGIAAYRDFRLGKVETGYDVQVLCMNCNFKKELLKKHEMKMNNKFYANYYNSL